jgi:hypothetical protein
MTHRVELFGRVEHLGGWAVLSLTLILGGCIEDVPLEEPPAAGLRPLGAHFGVCDNLSRPDFAATATLEPGAVPVPVGGRIENATYALQSIRTYGAEGRIRGSARAFLRVDGSHFESVFREGTDEGRFSGIVTRSDQHFTLVADCRAGDAGAMLHPRGSYTATGDELTLFESFRAATVVYDYVRMF